MEEAVDAGARPEELRRLVMARTGRVELALRVEQAARAGDLNAAGIYLAELEAEGMRVTHAMTEVL